MKPEEFISQEILAGRLTTKHLVQLVREFQTSRGLVVDGKPGPMTREALERRMPKFPGTEFHDRRASAAQAHGPGGKWKVGTRAQNAVGGICLHQTACVLGERPERWDTVGAHIGITRSGKVIWLHDWDHLVAHGNAWNASTIGIEIDGLYAGVQGDLKTVWDDPSTAVRETGMDLPEVQAAAARDVIRWIKGEMPWVKMLVAHRQSSKTRRNDPGSEIWQRVALPMMTELKMHDASYGDRDYTNGGYPIPEAWDPAKKGVRY